MKYKVTTFMLACILCLVAINLFSVNAAEVRTLKLDGNVTKGSTQSAVTYKLSPGKCGMVSVDITYNSISPMRATLKNLSSGVEKTFESIAEDQKRVLRLTYYAEVVDYQLTLEFENGDMNTRYAISGTFAALSSGEGTKGDSFDKAILLDEIDQTKGIVGFGDNSDCYKVSLNSQGKLKMVFRNSGQESVNLKIYDTYKELIKLETIGSNASDFAYEIEEANGIYYIVVDRVFTNGVGTNYMITTGDYVAVTGVKFPNKTLTLTAGSFKPMKATITPSNATEKVTYKSSNKKIATVNSSGKITAVKAGTATITAYSVNGNVKATIKVTVKAKTVSKVSLNIKTKTLEVGKTFQLKTTVSPKDAKTTYSYKSSNSAIAKVNGKGLITAVKNGSCTITVTTKNGKSAKCQITVAKDSKPTVTPKPTVTEKPTVAVTSIKSDNNMFMLKKGSTKTITYTIAPSNATDKKVTFSSQNKKIATVNSNGVVTAVAVGTTTVNATTQNGKTMVVTIIVY